jgi:segregation and condensation protein B
MKPDAFKLMETAQVKRIVEAAILAAGQPLSLVQLHALFVESDLVATEAVGQALEELRADYAGRGVELVEVASGFRFQVTGDVHPFVARLWTERQTKYSRALLETLSLVAYRQPITRAEIEQIRGVAVSTNIIRTLEEREWIRVVGHRDVPGKPALFGTTRQFLDYFNLKSLDQLPPLAEIRDIEDLEPQLELPEAGSIDAALDGDGDDAPARLAASEPANEPIAASAALPDEAPEEQDPEGDEPADAARGDEPDAHDAAVLDDPEDRK